MIANRKRSNEDGMSPSLTRYDKLHTHTYAHTAVLVKLFLTHAHTHTFLCFPYASVSYNQGHKSRRRNIDNDAMYENTTTQVSLQFPCLVYSFLHCWYTSYSQIDRYKSRMISIQSTKAHHSIRSPPMNDGESKMAEVTKHCHSCHTTETPEWRKGPMGKRNKLY